MTLKWYMTLSCSTYAPYCGLQFFFLFRHHFRKKPLFLHLCYSSNYMRHSFDNICHLLPFQCQINYFCSTLLTANGISTSLSKLIFLAFRHAPCSSQQAVPQASDWNFLKGRCLTFMANCFFFNVNECGSAQAE